MRRSGIAQVAATKGIDVILLDVSEKAVKAGIDAVERRLSAVVTKGKMTPPRTQPPCPSIPTLVQKLDEISQYWGKDLLGHAAR
jgi:3-hydroxyacyl-CoA dehydrogenase